MSYQNTLLEVEEPALATQDVRSLETCEEPTWFQPIVDTFDHRILAYDCISPYAADSFSSELDAVEAAIHSAAEQARQGLYFVNLIPSSIGDPELDMRSISEAVFDAAHAARQRGVRGPWSRTLRATRSIRTASVSICGAMGSGSP